ncbi:zinc ribbon domain-containing protein [Alkalihalobacillus trypoxylicola]|uniref:Zinc-ribbon domain-containing protein n=1 Tax=Alkalihalobacillus trypoxylicola TaxID=519424 RepID=A0A161PJW5_9BACI|nr:zinc-ribbon domain-containing protein [Alkalihalobacillus trypoxylicola]KYG34148.1 hypothetical protein AZF04_15075 [Alkalihalobacillus trypoxylicola]
MLYCKECGHQNNSSDRFCSECGQALSQNREASPSLNQEKPLKSKMKWTKKQLIITISSAIAAVLLFVGFQIGSVLTDKDRLIDQFGTALLDGDTKKIVQLLHSDDSRLEITEENVQFLVKHIEENPSYYTYLIDSLKSQSAFLENSDGEFSEDELDEYYHFDHPFYLTKNGTFALIFDHYSINVYPFYINLATNYANTTIFINDEEILTTDEEDVVFEYGPFMPGYYDFKAVYHNDYASLETSESLSLFSVFDQGYFLDLSIFADYITISNDYLSLSTNSQLYINDTAVDYDLDSAEPFGPVTLDGSLTLHAVLDFPWGSVATEPVAIEGDWIDLVMDSPFAEENSEALFHSILHYGVDFAEAFNQGDSSQFTNITESFREELKDEIELLKSYDETWVGEFIKVEIDPNMYVELNENDEYTAYANARFHYDSVYTDSSNEHIETSLDTTDVELALIYNQEENSWSIDSEYTNWYYDPTNSIELTSANLQ